MGFSVSQKSIIWFFLYSGSWWIEVGPFGLGQEPARCLEIKAEGGQKKGLKMREKAPEGASSLLSCAGAELMTPMWVLPAICLASLVKASENIIYHLVRVWADFFPIRNFPDDQPVPLCPWLCPYLVASGGESRMMAGQGGGRRWGKCAGVWEEGHGDERPERRALGGWGRAESTTHPGSLSSCFSLQMGSNLWCFWNVLDIE